MRWQAEVQRLLDLLAEGCEFMLPDPLPRTPSRSQQLGIDSIFGIDLAYECEQLLSQDVGHLPKDGAGAVACQPHSRFQGAGLEPH